MDTKSFISKILNSKLIIIIILIIVIGFGVNYTINKLEKVKTELQISKQNEKSLKDSLRISKNKIGGLVASKQILVAQNESDLKKLNDDMYNEVKKYKGKIHELTKLVASIKQDTVEVNNTEVVSLPNGDKTLNWDYSKVYDSENSRYISGSINFVYDSISKILTPLPTLITKDIINFNLTQGLRTTKDGKIEIFASSNYPGFTTSKLNSVIIDPNSNPVIRKFTKKHRFKLGVYTGYGLTANLINSTVTFGPQLGVGAMYTFW